MIISKYTKLGRSLCGRGIALLTVTSLLTTSLVAQGAAAGGEDRSHNAAHDSAADDQCDHSPQDGLVSHLGQHDGRC